MNQESEVVAECDRLTRLRAADWRTQNGGYQMRYWLTVHWPPWKEWKYAVGVNDSDDAPYVWLEDHKGWIGARLTRGDPVLIYQTRTGPKVVEQLPDGSIKIIEDVPHAIHSL
jgi:hypothetical protein